MLRKSLLALLIVAAAGASLAANADTLALTSFILATPAAVTGAGHTVSAPDSLAMYLACLGVMGLIARRRFR